MASPNSSGVYGDGYSYDFATWNDAPTDGTYDQPPEVEPSPSAAVSNLPGHPHPHSYHDTPSQHLASDDNEEIGLEFLRNQELSEEELLELCGRPLQLNKPTQMEVEANMDPLFGRVYKQDRPVAERPGESSSRVCVITFRCIDSFLFALLCAISTCICSGDFIAAMASIRRQVAMLSQTELFDSIARFPDATGGDNLAPVRGGGSVQGPSVTDAVDVDKLLAEMGGSPPHSVR